MEGKFPDTPDLGIVYNRPLESFKINSSKTNYYTEARECETTFHKIEEYEIESNSGYNYYSLVRCVPRQGRTHQIRLHLMQMGHPIVNDYLYNDKDISSRYTSDPNDIESAVSKIYRNYGYGDDKGFTLDCESGTRHISCKTNMSWEKDLTSKYGTNVPFCLECQLGGYVGQRLEADSDPMFMCLHAWKYNINSLGNSFEAPLPKWATDNLYIEKLLKSRENIKME